MASVDLLRQAGATDEELVTLGDSLVFAGLDVATIREQLEARRAALAGAEQAGPAPESPGAETGENAGSTTDPAEQAKPSAAPAD
jgi:hypothetical protein